MSTVNGGLIEVELCQKDKISYIKTIFKLPQKHSGMTYIASLTLPFKTCSFVLKVQAVEAGLTGQREAVIANRLISKNIVSIDENGYSNWLSDPYDDGFKSATLMNKSEDHRYDAEFPDHPLTQARQLLTRKENGLSWSSELERAQAFGK
ncbi:MAG: hypothetical protein J7621_27590 [Niastella sp.]|nr:hypothetical protein [Niastella sp.]